MSSACSEIIWLVRLLKELGITIPTPIILNANNTSAIQIALNPVYHECTKHIEVECHFIREKLEEKILTLPHVASTHQIADLFTKAINRDRHQFLISKLMLFDTHQFEGECEGS